MIITALRIGDCAPGPDGRGYFMPALPFTHSPGTVLINPADRKKVPKGRQIHDSS
jgi:hypothetical protein